MANSDWGKINPLTQSFIRSRRFSSRSGANFLSPWIIIKEMIRKSGKPIIIAQTDRDKLWILLSSKISATRIIAITNITRIIVNQLLTNNHISLASSDWFGTTTFGEGDCAITFLV